MNEITCWSYLTYFLNQEQQQLFDDRHDKHLGNLVPWYFGHISPTERRKAELQGQRVCVWLQVVNLEVQAFAERNFHLDYK